MNATLSPSSTAWEKTSRSCPANPSSPADLFGRYDPLGFNAGDANLYRYVGNNPTNTVDPTGLAQTRIPLNLIAASYISHFKTLRKDDMPKLGKATHDWFNSLNPKKFNVKTSWDLFTKFVSTGIETAENKLLLTELRILYKLALSTDKYYVVLSSKGGGTETNPIRGLKIRLGPTEDGPGSLDFGKPIGELALKIKPILDDYEISTDRQWAWARISLKISFTAGPFKQKHLILDNPRVWFGVENGVDYPKDGKIPVYNSDAASGKFNFGGLYDLNKPKNPWVKDGIALDNLPSKRKYGR